MATEPLPIAEAARRSLRDATATFDFVAQEATLLGWKVVDCRRDREVHLGGHVPPPDLILLRDRAVLVFLAPTLTKSRRRCIEAAMASGLECHTWAISDEPEIRSTLA